MTRLMAIALATFVVASASAETRTGSFTDSATVVDIAGEAWSANFASYVDANQEISWSVVVPENYDPDVPAGIIVYVSPSNSGRLPRDWATVLAEKNLIWIAANKSGNRADTRKRLSYALLGPSYIAKNYNVDSDRIYIAGLSGGGRVASIVAPAYPTIFAGAIYICGVNSLPDQLAENPTTLQSSRFVFLTGEDDFNRTETRNNFSEYLQAGLNNSHYLEIKRMGHQNPDGEGLAQAIAFLDAE